MSRRTAAWLAWSLWAVCVVLITLALLLDFMTEEFSFDEGGFRYSPGFAVLTGVLSAGVPGGRGADRLATTYQPHRLDLLWHGTALRSAAVHDRVRRLRPA